MLNFIAIVGVIFIGSEGLLVVGETLKRYAEVPFLRYLHLRNVERAISSVFQRVVSTGREIAEARELVLHHVSNCQRRDIATLMINFLLPCLIFLIHRLQSKDPTAVERVRGVLLQLSSETRFATECLRSLFETLGLRHEEEVKEKQKEREKAIMRKYETERANEGRDLKRAALNRSSQGFFSRKKALWKREKGATWGSEKEREREEAGAKDWRKLWRGKATRNPFSSLFRSQFGAAESRTDFLARENDDGMTGHMSQKIPISSVESQSSNSLNSGQSRRASGWYSSSALAQKMAEVDGDCQLKESAKKAIADLEMKRSYRKIFSHLHTLSFTKVGFEEKDYLSEKEKMDGSEALYRKQMIKR